MSDTYTKKDLLAVLRKGECNVTFKKSDGTTRKMRCTLQEDMLPTYEGKNGGEDKEVVVVLDLDKQSWRSFKVASVKKVVAA